MGSVVVSSARVVNPNAVELSLRYPRPSARRPALAGYNIRRENGERLKPTMPNPPESLNDGNKAVDSGALSDWIIFRNEVIKSIIVKP